MSVGRESLSVLSVAGGGGSLVVGLGSAACTRNRNAMHV